MFLKQKKINEGISLTAIKTDKFKSSVISFSLTFPMSKEAVAYNILLSQMLTRGTKSAPALALLNRRLDELYGSYVEIKSHNIGENVSLSIIAETLENKYVPDETDIFSEVLKIVSELILSPAFILDNFNRDFFEQEKKACIDNLNAEINNTRVYAAKRCVEIMNEDIAKPTSEELKELTKNATFEKLVEHYRTIILNTPINVFYIGCEDEESVALSLQNAFKNHFPSARHTLITPRPINKKDLRDIRIQMPVSQGKLALGFCTDTVISATDDSYYAMLMLNEIFGGSASSKLFLNVREKMSLCYYCSSSYSHYSGVMLVSSGFEMKNYEIAKKTILDQLEDIKNGIISDTEFFAAQKSIINSYRQLLDSPFDMQAFFGDRALFNVSDDLDTAQQKLLSVTKQDVIEIASRIKLCASFFIEGKEDIDEEEDEND